VFEVFVVEGVAAGVLFDVPPAAGAGELAGEDAGVDVDPADASFLSPAGAFSPSEGGFILLE
jgi:hypothetical protein